MSEHKKKALSKPWAPSCVITLDKNGVLEVQALNESADPALALRDELRKTKGRDDGGNQLYAHALPIIRGKSTRQLHFA